MSVWKLEWPEGYYGDTSDNTCQRNFYCSYLSIAWDPSWKTWNEASNSDWIEWQMNITHSYFNSSGQWVDTWPSKFYGNTHTKKCDSCHPFCTSWYGSLSTEWTAWDSSNRYVLVSPDTCQYLTCPELSFYDSGSNSCINCDENCKNWYGNLSTNCVDCPYSKFLSSADHSWKLCHEINSGLIFEPLSNTWIEKWGKGFNLGFIEWDDGNILEGDGCDQNCQVETDWEWTGGNSTHPDSWISLIGPEAEFTYISSSTHLGTIVFTENVTFGDIGEGDIGITIKGPLAPYKFKYK